MKKKLDMLNEQDPKEGFNFLDQDKAEEEPDLDDLLALALAYDFAQFREQQAENYYAKVSYVGFVVILLLYSVFIAKAANMAEQFPLSAYLVILSESVSCIAILPLLIKKLLHGTECGLFSHEDLGQIMTSLNWVRGTCLGSLPLCICTAILAPTCIDGDLTNQFCKMALVIGVILIVHLAAFAHGRAVRKLMLTDFYLVFSLLAVPMLQLAFA